MGNDLEPAASGRLLIVEDTEAVRQVLTDYFGRRGYTVVTAANGQEALVSFDRERPDIVLLDIRMPGMDGLTVLRRLHDADPGVPVIMVTANEDEALARDTLAIGAFDYVAKPFDFAHLDRMVSAAALYSRRTSNQGEPDSRDANEEWSRLVSDVFHIVRGMAAEARASTGIRLEDTVLRAARLAIAGRSVDAAEALSELVLLIGVASRLGDLSAAGRAVMQNAVKTVQAVLPRS